LSPIPGHGRPSGAAYLTLESDTGDRLIGIETPAANRVMLHGTETDASGVSRMVHIAELDLPPGETVTLAPGGMHLMLMNLATKLKEGSTFPLILRFEADGDRTVEVPVLGVGATGPEGAE
jgi:copper(I)-binding protein